MANMSHRSVNKFSAKKISVPAEEVETAHWKPEAGENSFMLGVLLDIQRHVGTSTAKLDNVETTIARIETKVSDLDDKMGKSDAKLDRLAAKLDNVETSIVRLETKVSDLDDKIDKLTAWKNRIIGGALAISGFAALFDYLVTFLKKFF